MEDLSNSPDIPIGLVGAGASTVVLESKVTGDSQWRYTQTADGTMSWGSGSGAADLSLARVAANQWGPVSDNAYDLGNATHRWRSVYWGTQLLGPNGSAATPSVSFASSTGSGLFWDVATSQVRGATAGAVRLSFGSAGTIVWGSTLIMASAAGATETTLVSSAAVLSQQNSTTAQALRIYGTTTGPKYLSMSHDGTNGIITAQSGVLVLGANNGTQLFISATGILTPNGSDNVLDLGTVSNRFRNFYWGTQLLGPDGTVGVPSYSFSNSTNSGHYWVSDGVYTSFGGAANLRVGTNAVQLATAGALRWGTGDPGSTADLFIRRGAANFLSQSNGVSAQGFRIYNTTDSDTSPVNYERLSISWSSNTLTIGTQQGGTGGARTLLLDSSSQVGIAFAGTNRWAVGSGAHLVAAADNSYDFGQSGASRARSIYWGTQALGPDGTSSNPAFAFASEVGLGLTRNASGVGSFVAGAAQASGWNSSGLVLHATVGQLQWASTNLSGAADVILVRDAANTLAQRNGTTAQTKNIYNTFTSSTNYERLEINWAAAANICNIWTAKGSGGGSARALQLGTDGTAGWGITTSRHFIGVTDNSFDIGASGATRPRDLYLATSIRIGTNPASAGAVRLAHGGEILARNNANSADASLLSLGVAATDVIRLGGGNFEIRLEPGSSDIRWGKALVALGGGAAPTFGTIGGAGPATAAQNSWKRMLDSTGAACWCPVWK